MPGGVSALTNGSQRLEPYVPRVLLRHLVDTPDAPAQVVDGTCVFVDVSGFTKLSERLARRGGREGAEQLADAIGRCFADLLEVAYAAGGGLLKFGGDALLLLFEGPAHVERACASAVAMRQRLREAGRIDTGGAAVQLKMSVGVHSAPYHLFLVGGSHRELVITGPAASEVVRMEKQAGTGEIVVSASTAARLPAHCLGVARDGGRLLRAAPATDAGNEFEQPVWAPEASMITDALSTELRAHVLAGAQPPDHRTATVAFVRFEGTDALISREGPEAAAAVLGRLLTELQAAVDERQVCFLGSDVDADGGKIILTAGAPRAIGDEDERLLLALRRFVESDPPLPVKIGVHRGALFAGDIGPWYRRTYTVMGDVVNLTARLMAKAPPGEIYATPAVLGHSATQFQTEDLEPFRVKGKAHPVEAVSVGAVAKRLGRRDGVPVRFPLIGREPELEMIERALDDASRGRGRLIELVSEPGMGRSRLMEEVHDRAEGVRALHATCEAYTTATPYRTVRDLLRQASGMGLEDPDEQVLERLRAMLAEDDPTLLPWLPLLAIAFDVAAPSTPEVSQLAAEFRRPKLREVVLRFLRHQLPGWALIEIEDAHQMDEASADLLEALAHELPLLPWLVVVTRRDRETGYAAAIAAHVVRLELGPLEPDDTLALAQAVTESSPLPPHVVALAAERSGGSPQFLRDLLRAAWSGSRELPDSIESAALARIDRLEPGDRMLVRRASVLGVTFHPRHLVDVLPEDAPVPEATTWERLAAYFQPEADGYLRFRRQVVRDVAYGGLPFALRRRLHAAAGARLEGDLGARADDEAVRLSVHFLLAGDNQRAWRYARAAASRAHERYAYADAAHLYRRALDAARNLGVARDDLATVWESLADASTKTGELDAASVALTTARRLVGGDALRTARLLLQHARITRRAGRVGHAVRWCGRAMRALGDAGDQPSQALRAEIIATLAAVRQRQGRSSEAIRLAQEAITVAEASGAEIALGDACHALDWALVESGRLDEARYSARALEIFTRHGMADREAAVRNNMGAFAYFAGHWDEAVELYGHAAEAGVRAGDADFAAFGDCNVGELLSDQGHLAEAEPLLRRALQVWRGTEDDHGVAFATTLLGRLLVRDDRIEDGMGLLEAALEDFRRLGAEIDAAWVESLLAEAALFQGRPEDAERKAAQTLDGVAADTRLEPLLHYLRGVARAQAGDARGATECFERCLSKATGLDRAFEMALALDGLVELAAEPDRRRERDELLTRLGIAQLPAPPLARPHEAAALAV